MLRKALVLLAAATFIGGVPIASAVPPQLPTNDCIEALMDAGFNYKTARRICFEEPRR